MISKHCTKCQQERPVRMFHSDARMRSGLACWCKFCKSDHERARYARRKGEDIRALDDADVRMARAVDTDGADVAKRLFRGRGA